MKTKKINRTFKKLTAALLVLTLCLGAVMTEGITVAKAESSEIDVQFDVTYHQTNARSMLELVNDFRTGDGANYVDESGNTVTLSNLSELTYDYDLEKIAMQRAAEIVLSFSHTRPNGGTCYGAYSDYGYYYRAAAENIAWGQTTVSSAFNSWKEDYKSYSDQGHRRNMLGSYSNIGIACVSYNGWYCWVQEFSSPSNTSAETAANDSTTTVTVEVQKSKLSNISASNISMTVGETVSFPSVTASYASDCCGTVTVTIPPTSKRTASMGAISISSDGTTITAIAAGTAMIVLITEFDEYDVMITVKNSSSTGGTGNSDDGSGSGTDSSGDGKTGNDTDTTNNESENNTSTADNNGESEDSVGDTDNGDGSEDNADIAGDNDGSEDDADITGDNDGSEDDADITDGDNESEDDTDIIGSDDESENDIDTDGNDMETEDGSGTDGGNESVDGNDIDNGFTANGATYQITSTENLTVEYMGYENAAGGVKIPATVKIDGTKYTVTSIADSAFSGNKNITSVTIGKNVTTIGKRAFKGCTQLTSVTFGANVKTIKAGAFQGCKKLTVVTLKTGVKKIGKNAFKNCKKITTLKIKSTKLTSVGANAFSGISSSAKIKVPSGKLLEYKKLIQASGFTGKVKAI